MASQVQKYHFVLVHGASHGAWCWYKLVNLLQQSGHKVSALDMAASGGHPEEPDKICSFSHYTQPLSTFFQQSLLSSEKVVLVGHSLGGLNLIHASQHFAHKIAVSVYVSAVMLPVPLNIYKEGLNLANSISYLSDLEIETHGKGANNTPTSIMLNKKHAKDIYYNMSPTEDVVLAAMLCRPFSVGALNLDFDTTLEEYGSVPTVFIKTENDKAFPLTSQNRIICLNKPAHVFSLASDHSPFFSCPSQLQQILIHIAQIYIGL